MYFPAVTIFKLPTVNLFTMRYCRQRPKKKRPKAIAELDVEDTDIESFLRLGGKFYHTYPQMVKERGKDFRAGTVKVVVPGE